MPSQGPAHAEPVIAVNANADIIIVAQVRFIMVVVVMVSTL